MPLKETWNKNDMAKPTHKGKRNAVETVARKARARRSASVMKPEYLAEIERFRLMDDDFMSKCLEQVSQFKNSEEGRRNMCKAMERMKAEGKRETMFATAKRMLESGMLTLKDIAKFSGLSLAQVKKLQASIA